MRVSLCVFFVLHIASSDVSIDWYACSGGDLQIDISEGETVRWVWTDDLDHTVTCDAAGCSEPSGSDRERGAGTTYSHTFNKAGDYPFKCEVHGANCQGGRVSVSTGGDGSDGGDNGRGNGSNGPRGPDSEILPTDSPSPPPPPAAVTPRRSSDDGDDIPNEASLLWFACNGYVTATIRAGGKVTWIMNDDREHTITCSGRNCDEPASGSRIMGLGETFAHTFNRPGEYDFYCIIHGEECQSGTIFVLDFDCEDSPEYAVDCPMWADTGQCESSPLFMGTHCQRSCGLCGSRSDSEDTISVSDPFGRLIPTIEEEREVRDALTSLYRRERPEKLGGFLRLAFHDSGTFDRRDGTGGSFGCVIYEQEEEHNAGLDEVIEALEPIVQQFRGVMTRPDIYQLSGVEIVRFTGGPDIQIRYGRPECTEQQKRLELSTRLCDAERGGFTGDRECEQDCWDEILDHLLTNFRRMGFSDPIRALVALSGGHTLGGTHEDKSGFFDGFWTDDPETFNNEYFRILLEEDWEFAGFAADRDHHQSFISDDEMMLVSDVMIQFFGMPGGEGQDQEPNLFNIAREYMLNEDRFFHDYEKFWLELIEFGHDNLTSAMGGPSTPTVLTPLTPIRFPSNPSAPTPPAPPSPPSPPSSS